MDHIRTLKNPVQRYAWGSYTAIPELLGQQPNPDAPAAELWMGAHPKAPSMVKENGDWESLERLISEHPEEILGNRAASEFQNKLPYLFKVLAAAKPLSLQAHPSLSQAREGFRRENNLEIPLDAPHRNYKDDNHKPECLCAMTPFWALSGFRKVSEILSHEEKIHVAGLDNVLNKLRDQPNSEGLKAFFHGLMTLAPEVKRQVTEEVVFKANNHADDNAIYHWMVTLANEYPGDIGICSPLFLNLVQLQPGEAIYLPAGELHAYLEGVGIELMANSDNVLRGGLTPKHVDLEELLSVLNFEERNIRILSPEPDLMGEATYSGGVKEFVLSTIAVNRNTVYQSATDRCVEILLCTSGSSTIIDVGKDERIILKKGTSVIIPAAVERYVIKGEAMHYKAAVPL